MTGARPRPGRFARRAGLALACALALAPGPSMAEDRALAAAVKRSAVSAALIAAAVDGIGAADGAAARLDALSRAAASYEEGLAAMRLGLRLLALRREALAARVAAGRARSEAAVAMLLGMERTPAPAVLVNPAGPLGHLRAGHALAEIAPALRAQAVGLAELADRVAALDAALAGLGARMRGALAAAQDARAAQAEELRENGAAADALPLSPALRRALRDGQQAMREIARLLEQDPAPPAVRPVSAPDWGALPLPLAGEIRSRWGARDETGAAVEGLRIAAPTLAPVLAPFDAILRFAGPLDGYGQVAVLEPEPGRLLVLAGLGAILHPEGAALHAGQIVGRTGRAGAGAPEFLIEADGSGGARSEEILYVEVREDGTPVDPARWFAMDGAASLPAGQK